MSNGQWTENLKQVCPNRVGELIFVPDWAVWSVATGFVLFGNRRQLLISVTEDGWVSVTEEDLAPVRNDAAAADHGVEDAELQSWPQSLARKVLRLAAHPVWPNPMPRLRRLVGQSSGGTA